MSEDIELPDDDEDDMPPLDLAFYKSQHGREHWKPWWDDDAQYDYVREWADGKFTVEQIQGWVPIVGDEGVQLAEKFIQFGITPEQMRFIIQNMVKDTFIDEKKFTSPFDSKQGTVHPFHIFANVQEWAMEMLLETISERIKNTPPD